MYDKIICGSLAGIISSTICYPLDTIKIIAQSRIKNQQLEHFIRKTGYLDFIGE